MWEKRSLPDESSTVFWIWGKYMCGIYKRMKAWMFDPYKDIIQWLCDAVGVFFSVQFESTCPLSRKNPYKINTKLFCVITFILCWNIYQFICWEQCLPQSIGPRGQGWPSQSLSLNHNRAPMGYFGQTCQTALSITIIKTHKRGNILLPVCSFPAT